MTSSISSHEHDTLVANVKIILADVHTTSNVRILPVDADQHLAVLVIQSLAVNAAQIVMEGIKCDVLHNVSHDGLLVVFPATVISSETMTMFTQISHGALFVGPEVKQVVSMRRQVCKAAARRQTNNATSARRTRRPD